MKKSKENNLIHLKFDYEEAVEGKKNILYSEKNLMLIVKKINNYLYLRKKELKEKEQLYKKIKNVLIIISKLQKTAPKIEIPKFLKKDVLKKPHKEEIKEQKSTIDEQLREIQEKLKALQN